MREKYTIERDLDEAVAMAGALPLFVPDARLFWNLGDHFARLSLGTFLLRLRRLRAFRRQMTAAQTALLDRICHTHDNVLLDWPLPYLQKLEAETRSRLQVITCYLDESRDDTGYCVDSYLPQAYSRTLIQEVMDRAEQLHSDFTTTLYGHVRAVDMRLRGLVQPERFLWDGMLSSMYARDRFWWLYHRPHYTALRNAPVMLPLNVEAAGLGLGEARTAPPL